MRTRKRGFLTNTPLFDTHTHTYIHTHPAVAEVREAGLPQGGASSVLPPWRRFFALIPFGPCSGAEPKRAYFSKVFVQGTLSFEGSPSPSINTRRCAKKQMEHTLESSSAHNEVPAPMGAGRGGDYSKALLGGCLLSCDDRYIRRGVFLSLSQCGAPGADTPLSQCLPHVSCTSTYTGAPPGLALFRCVLNFT